MIRSAVDAAKRAALLSEARRAVSDGTGIPPQACEHCLQEFFPTWLGQRFCSRAHQKQAWLMTEKGRAMKRNRQARRRAQLRQAA